MTSGEAALDGAYSSPSPHGAATPRALDEAAELAHSPAARRRCHRRRGCALRGGGCRSAARNGAIASSRPPRWCMQAGGSLRRRTAHEGAGLEGAMLLVPPVHGSLRAAHQSSVGC
eukprot:scaffold178798_cov36-Tisochrysis_lutea.AAC.2